ncbi:hypothetical protein ACQUJT_20350 [Ralstonia pseudosolanacearum]
MRCTRKAAARAFAALAGKDNQPAATRLDALSGLECALKAQACDTESIDAQRARLMLAQRRHFQRSAQLVAFSDGIHISIGAFQRLSSSVTNSFAVLAKCFLPSQIA